ncbi:hypothetical protein Q31b_43000 [Novipirellula aureliae]|uniref:Uncharacterized protein n=1 Tax=Novipirellula aureliae TaxID=2527966 RepID=A0A5C6DLM8_9BACT|nr:hypothetical protein [Novipirellula aureliae]TWU37512.1 hypothetical protein Q31b_43000 [Novipirellula aureliae]
MTYSNPLQTTSVSIIARQVPVLATADLERILRQVGYESTAIRAELKRLRRNKLMHVGYANLPPLHGRTIMIKSTKPIDEMVQSISSIIRDSGKLATRPTEYVFASRTLSGLAGKPSIASLSGEMLYRQLRLSKAFTNFTISHDPMDWQTAWPTRKQKSAVAKVAGFPDSPRFYVAPAAMTTSRVLDWLQQINQKEGRYIVC